MENWQVFAATITAILTAAGTALRIFGAKVAPQEPAQGAKNGSEINGVQSQASEIAALRERVASLETGLRNAAANIEGLRKYTEDAEDKLWREIANIDSAFTTFIGDVRGRIGEIVGQLNNFK